MPYCCSNSSQRIAITLLNKWCKASSRQGGGFTGSRKEYGKRSLSTTLLCRTCVARTGSVMQTACSAQHANSGLGAQGCEPAGNSAYSISWATLPMSVYSVLLEV